MRVTKEVEVDIDIDDLIDDMSKNELLEVRERINKELGRNFVTTGGKNGIIELEDINTRVELELFEALRKIYQNRVRISSEDYKVIFDIANQL